MADGCVKIPELPALSGGPHSLFVVQGGGSPQCDLRVTTTVVVVSVGVVGGVDAQQEFHQVVERVQIKQLLALFHTLEKRNSQFYDVVTFQQTILLTSGLPFHFLPYNLAKVS